MPRPILVSHHLCPYVQRAVIVADEKGMDVERVDVDLARKPDWFVALSPTGKVPLLRVGDAVLFESAAICEYLDEVSPGSLHPEEPLLKARHRAWIEFASGLLADVAGLYAAPDEPAFAAKRLAIQGRLDGLERATAAGPFFEGAAFHLVDAVYGPVFRYFDAFDRLIGLDLLRGHQKLRRWRQALAARPSVARAVAPDYPRRLEAFLRARGSHLSRLSEGRRVSAAAAAP